MKLPKRNFRNNYLTCGKKPPFPPCQPMEVSFIHHGPHSWNSISIILTQLFWRCHWTAIHLFSLPVNFSAINQLNSPPVMKTLSLRKPVSDPPVGSLSAQLQHFLVSYTLGFGKLRTQFFRFLCGHSFLHIWPGFAKQASETWKVKKVPCGCSGIEACRLWDGSAGCLPGRCGRSSTDQALGSRESSAFLHRQQWGFSVDGPWCGCVFL